MSNALQQSPISAPDCTAVMTCVAQPKHWPAAAVYVCTPLMTSNDTLLSAAVGDSAVIVTGAHCSAPTSALAPIANVSE
jgi:hypothetical protein